jgi:hypothetical protein
MIEFIIMVGVTINCYVNVVRYLKELEEKDDK